MLALLDPLEIWDPFQEAGSESIRICLATLSGVRFQEKVGSAVSQKSLRWGPLPGPTQIPPATEALIPTGLFLR